MFCVKNVRMLVEGDVLCGVGTCVSDVMSQSLGHLVTIFVRVLCVDKWGSETAQVTRITTSFSTEWHSYGGDAIPCYLVPYNHTSSHQC